MNPDPDLHGFLKISNTGSAVHGLNVMIANVNKTYSTNLYPPMKGYLRETCKSQKINPIYLTLVHLQYHSDHNKSLSSMF